MEITLTRVTKITRDEPLAPIRGLRCQKYLVSDLPFPGNKTQYWRKYFVPSLIAWAGSQPDPFGTNYGVGTEAALVWGQVFPTIELTPKDCDTLSSMVSNLFHLTTLGYWH